MKCTICSRSIPTPKIDICNHCATKQELNLDERELFDELVLTAANDSTVLKNELKAIDSAIKTIVENKTRQLKEDLDDLRLLAAVEIKRNRQS